MISKFTNGFSSILKNKGNKRKKDMELEKLQSDCKEQYKKIKFLLAHDRVMSQQQKNFHVSYLRWLLEDAEDARDLEKFSKTAYSLEVLLKMGKDIKKGLKCKESPLKVKHLRTLGLPPTTSDFDTIKKQYRKLAFRYHPDKGGSTEQFQKLTLAFNALKQNFQESPI